jgi:hypothetical protein
MTASSPPGATYVSAEQLLSSSTAKPATPVRWSGLVGSGAIPLQMTTTEFTNPTRSSETASLAGYLSRRLDPTAAKA